MPKQKSTAEKPAPKTAAKTPAAKTAAKPARPAGKTSLHGSRGSLDAPAAQASLDSEELHRLIQEAAYFKAKARNFAPGHEVQDWIEAESEVRLRFESGAQRQGRAA